MINFTTCESANYFPNDNVKLLDCEMSEIWENSHQKFPDELHRREHASKLSKYSFTVHVMS